MCDIKLREARKFTGKYRGISFEISHHGYGEEYRPEGTWCYYILLNENQVPSKYKKDFILDPVFDDKKRLSHNYMSAKIADLDWHHGITYYSKEGGADGEPIFVKMGCDYGHYWDENRSYDERTLLYDVKNTIDKLFSIYPEIKVYSNMYGGYFKVDEGEMNKNGDFVAFEEKERWEADKKAREVNKDG